MLALLAQLTLLAGPPGKGPPKEELAAQCSKSVVELGALLCGPKANNVNPTVVDMVDKQRGFLIEHCTDKDSREALKELDACLKTQKEKLAKEGPQQKPAGVPELREAAVRPNNTIDAKQAAHIRKDPEYQRVHARYKEASKAVNQANDAVAHAANPAAAEGASVKRTDALTAQSEAMGELQNYFEAHKINPYDARLAGLW
jgi:hypothetical protein